MEIKDEVLAMLSCEIELRPAGAPSIDEVAAAIKSVRMAGGAVVVAFDPERLCLIEAFAAAERLCCHDIGWEVRGAPTYELWVTASDQQGALLSQMFLVSSQPE